MVELLLLLCGLEGSGVELNGNLFVESLAAIKVNLNFHSCRIKYAI